MSVRRLADDTVQPDSFTFNRTMAKEAKGWIKKYPKGREQSAVIPLLMLAQEQDGWVTKASIERVAEMLDMPLIRVLEVATFYTQFQLQPVGSKAHIQICGTTPCMLRGSEDLIKLCKKRIHPEPFHLNDEGTLSWEEVECQGACVNAPMVMIFKDTYEDLTVERLDEIIEAFEAGRGDTITPGPQIDRIYSAPEGGLTTLTGKQPARKNAAAKKPAAKKPTKTKAGKPPHPKGINATMKIAETAHEADEVTHPKPKKKPAAAALTNRLATIEDDAAPKTVKAKRATTAKKSKAAIGTDMGTTLDNVKAVSEAKQAVRKTPAKTVGKSNPTMNIAATASGRAKPAKKADAGKPAAIKKPSKPDDLKMIAGIGPKIEGILHKLGIWTWAQIASWKKAERDWVNEHLSFKGRIEREDWVKQAKALAKGGRDEYVKVFGKEPR